MRGKDPNVWRKDKYDNKTFDHMARKENMDGKLIIKPADKGGRIG